MEEIIEKWNKHYTDNSYQYRLINMKDIRNPLLSVEQVIEEFQRLHGWNTLIHHEEIGVREIIH